MTEPEYLNLTFLTRVRDAIKILDVATPDDETGKQLRQVLQTFHQLNQTINARISIQPED